MRHLTGFRRWNAATFLLLLSAATAYVAVSCGGGGGHGVFNLMAPSQESGPQIDLQDPNPPEASPELMQQLTEQLMSDLASRGKDASSGTVLPPSGGNEVPDLNVIVLDPDGGGKQPPYGASIRWAERLLGDYDQNGLVNLADLTALGKYFGYTVKYDDPELHGGLTNIPLGDPDDFGDVPSDAPPAAGSGAFNWRLARIDGDGNGIIGLPDVTVIAQHWQEGLSGYQLLRKGPNDADFVPMPDPSNPGGVMTIRRFAKIESTPDNLKLTAPIMYASADFYFLEEPNPDSAFEYKVVPYNSTAAEFGPESVPVSVLPFAGSLSNGGVIPQLDAIVIAPGTSQANAAGELTLSDNKTVQFSAAGTYLPLGFSPIYLWDYDGDGNFDFSTTDPEYIYEYTVNARFDAAVKIIRSPENRGISSINRSASQASIFGNNASATKEIVVLGDDDNIPPTASITAPGNTSWSVPVSIQFDASGSIDDDGEIVSYEWDFDNDGIADYISAEATANHTFNRSEFVRIRLRVVDEDGGYAFDYLDIGLADENGKWPPRASLIASPASGSAPLNVYLTAEDSFDFEGRIKSYEWDLDGDFSFDINSGTEPRLNYTFPENGIYNVWVRVTDIDDLFDLERVLVTVNTAPFAGVLASPSSGPGPLRVQFNASSSQDLDGTIVKYEWDWDNDGVFDLNTGILPQAEKTFFRIGSNTVVLRVTDNLGASSTQSVVVNVTTPQINNNPTVSIKKYQVDGPFEDSEGTYWTATFSVEASDPEDEDGAITGFRWDWEGDGTADYDADEFELIVTTTYREAGRYRPRVTAIDNLFGESEAFVEIYVGADEEDLPTAKFTVKPSGAGLDEFIKFDATGSVGSGLTYEWSFSKSPYFADGSSASDISTWAAWASEGPVTASLKIRDSEGRVAFNFEKVVIGEVPQVKLLVDRRSVELPYGKFVFDASRSTGEAGDGYITLFEWDMDGDGIFEKKSGVNPVLDDYIFGLSSLTKDENGVYDTPMPVYPRVRVTNEIGATSTNFVKIGNDFVTQYYVEEYDDDDILQEVPITEILLDNRYDEIEDNDSYQTANMLVSINGSEDKGAFEPGESITHVSENYASDPVNRADLPLILDPPLVEGGPIPEPVFGGSLGERTDKDDDTGLPVPYYDGDDNDWYTFRLAQGAQVEARATFPDLSSSRKFYLRLYDSDGRTILAQDVTENGDAGDVIKVNYWFRDGGQYFLRLTRFNGPGSDYELELDCTALEYDPDNKVDNDNKDFENADEIVLGDPEQPYWGKLGPSDIADFYKFSYDSNQNVFARVDFTHTAGDIDMYMYDNDHVLVGYSAGSTDGEQLWGNMPETGGTGFVKLVLHGGAGANYTLRVGAPPGTPQDFEVMPGSEAGTIKVDWEVPGNSGNSVIGYRVLMAEEEFGFYEQYGEDITGGQTEAIIDFSEPDKLALQTETFWFKVLAYNSDGNDGGSGGEGEPTEPKSGYATGVKPVIGPAATAGQYVDKVRISFQASPSFIGLGNGGFGAAPTRYEIFADPQDSPDLMQETRIGTIYPQEGEQITIPADGSIPSYNTWQYSFDWYGGPWQTEDLLNMDVDFTIKAIGPFTGDEADSAVITGKMSNVQGPTELVATQGLFQETIRINWKNPAGSVQPDRFHILFKADMSKVYIDITPDGILYQYLEDDDEWYEYIVSNNGMPASSGRYRVYSATNGFGLGGFDEVYGFCNARRLQVLPIGGSWTGNGPAVLLPSIQLYRPRINDVVVEDVVFPRGVTFRWETENGSGSYTLFQTYDIDKNYFNTVLPVGYGPDTWVKVWAYTWWADPTEYPNDPPFINLNNPPEGWIETNSYLLLEGWSQP